MFDERKALQMTLESLLEERAALRKNYAEQDKSLGQEIKQVLLRIRELDERDGKMAVREEQADGKTGTTGGEKSVSQRKRYVRHDFPALARQVEEILEEAQEPLTLAQLCSALNTRYGIELSSPYISIRKSMEHTDRVKMEKDGRKLHFLLK